MVRILNILFLLALWHHAVSARTSTIPETIDIRIFSGDNVRKVSFMPLAGRYIICDSDHKKVLGLRSLNSITIEKTRDGLLIRQQDSVVFTGTSITLQGAAFHNSFMITPLDRDLESRIYDGDVNLVSMGNQLNIINRVSIESYVAGTVQHESGFNRHSEFYKVQAVIIRTYALSNLRRHQQEGFHLCDKVHCQAYYGKTVNPPIVRAVENTRGQVVTDRNGVLLNAVYHANCGGQTVNSEDLWPNAMPYLRSRTDTFCLTMPGARWKKSISILELRTFMTRNHRLQPDESILNHIYNLRQNQRVHHLDPEKIIHLRHVRDHFNLRSTYFTVKQQEDNLHLSGRGYGHGVGLCQEGAMKRAEHGHTKKEILNFYYRDSRILTLEPEVIY